MTAALEGKQLTWIVHYSQCAGADSNSDVNVQGGGMMLHTNVDTKGKISDICPVAPHFLALNYTIV
jgi:hypothetical protein